MRLKKAALSGILTMLIASGIPILLAEMYHPYQGSQNLWPMIEARAGGMAETYGDFYRNSMESLIEHGEQLGQEEDKKKLETDNGPSAVRFNMAFLFPQNAKGPMDSYGGQVFSLLSEKEDNWKAGIFGLPDQNPASVAGQAGKTSEKTTGAESWGKVRISFYNGDGEPISTYSNVREILSLASVYAYYHDIWDKETFLNYAQNLWNNSHRYEITVSDFYYCDGNCLKREETEAEIFQTSQIQTEEQEEVLDGTDNALTETAQTSTAAPEAALPETAAGPWGPPSDSKAVVPETTEGSSQADDENRQDESLEVQTYITAGPGMPPEIGPGVMPSKESVEESQSETQPAEETQPEQVPSKGEVSCQGHWDLTVNVYITGIEETNNLFTKDTIGKKEDDWIQSWQGWDEIRQSEARTVKEQDWYTLYGLTVADKTYIRSPLSDGEISYFMGLIPEETSQVRRNVVYHALQSVGRIPYYWGGKPSCAGYEGNGFGTVTAPDTEGRVLRGLDCSGWVDWVYWTALETPFHSGSTAGLMERGQAIERSQLRPGDIILRRGESSHAFMFLAWTQDGGMYLIHEMGNYTNNVMAGRYYLDWPYYRNLIGD